MGALYEDVEKFFGDMFAWYGRVVARWPLPFVLVPLLVCGLLGLGMFRLQYETDLETLYTPIDSTAAKDQLYLQTLFHPTDDTTDFYPHQPLHYSAYAEIMASAKPNHSFPTPQNPHNHNVLNSNVLNHNVLHDIRVLVDAILNISTGSPSQPTFLNDICARNNNQCVILGESVLESLQWSETDSCYFLNSSKEIRQEAVHVLAELSSENHCLSARALRLRFYLNSNRTSQNLAWQKAFLHALQDYHASNATAIDITVSDALDIELSRHVARDTRYLLFSIVTMLLYATLQGAGGNWVSNHVTLAYAGVFAALLSIVAAFGFLSICGLRFVNMSGVMPFLVIGIGVDDMFQLMTEWRHTSLRDGIEQRMATTLRQAAVSITITSLTDLMAFCIGATSPFVSVKHFCACSGIAIFFCYINQLTFFSGVIVLHARRVQQGRHCVTCLKTKARCDLEADQRSTCHVLLCSGHPSRTYGEEDGVCGNISRGLYMYYPKFILHWLTKICVMALFILYLTLSIWGASQLQNGFSLEDVIAEDAYVATYIHKERELFPDDGPIVMFVIDQPVEYHLKDVQWKITDTLDKAMEVDYVIEDGLTSWLGAFQDYLNRTRHVVRHKRDFFKELHAEFLPSHPEFANDVRFSSDNRSIVASRFYVRCEKMKNSSTAADLMLAMRTVANSSNIPFLAFSTDFLYFEHYVCILKNTLLAIGVAIIGMLFVALVFIPHPIAVSAVTLSMISAVLGMVGFMTFWGLALSAITTIQIILSIGICVDSTVHMSHAFMTATGKNRNERVSVALEKVGIPILNGACSSLLGILMLALGSSYIFTSFFKTMFLVVVLGLLHSLVFLPVILSFIGPRRTSKPRVFIPVSPSSRSLQDIYRANSVVRPPPHDPPIHYEPVVIGATLKTRSLTDITAMDDGHKIQLAKETRRVSFAVGEERKYQLENRFLETKVDPEMKNKFRPISAICETDEEEEEDELNELNELSPMQPFPPPQPPPQQQQTTPPSAHKNDLNDNIDATTDLLPKSPPAHHKPKPELKSCLKRYDEFEDEEEDFRDASDNSPLTPKKSPPT